VGEKIRLPREEVETWKVPTEDRDFLVCDGLPEESPLYVTFRHEGFETLDYEGNRYIVLGDDFGTWLCLTEESGELVSVSPDTDLPTRFVNSSIRDFVALLDIFQDTQRERRGTGSEGDGKVIEELRRSFAERDPSALDDPESWWSVVLEQMESGEL